MKFIKVLFTFFSLYLLVFSFNSCSDNKEEYEDDQKGFVLINGVEHKVLDAGYVFSIADNYIWTHLLIEDRESINNKSSIDFQLPLDATEEWFHLAECESYWRVLLRNSYVGDHRSMSLISAGKVLIKRLGEKNNNNDCKYQVAFEISLNDETKVVGDIQTIFVYDNVPIGGR